MPRVSVGLPVYDGDQYLRETIESLLAQDFDDFELIISDNGSTDGTEAICREFAERDPRVRYVREPENRGASWNYHRVFELARGEYFRWACHDDTSAPEHLRRCVEALDAAPASVILVYTRSIHVDEQDEKMEDEEIERIDTRGLPPYARLRLLARRLRHSSLLYGLMRRDALVETELLGPYEGSDYVLLAELGLRGEFQELPEFLFSKRVHSGMSRQAQMTQASVARWFDTSNRQRFYFPHWNLLWKHLRVIRRSRLGWIDKLRSTWVVLWYWGPRYWRILVKELLAPMVPRFRSYESWRPKRRGKRV